jgi:hypothetical protein
MKAFYIVMFVFLTVMLVIGTGWMFQYNHYHGLTKGVVWGLFALDWVLLPVVAIPVIKS